MKFSKLYFGFRLESMLSFFNPGMTNGFLMGASMVSIGIFTERFRTAAW